MILNPYIHIYFGEHSYFITYSYYMIMEGKKKEYSIFLLFSFLHHPDIVLFFFLPKVYFILY